MSPSTDSPAVLHVCRSCTRRGIATAGPALAAALREALAAAVGAAVEVRESRCMGECRRRCRACIVGARRWSWLFGDLHPDQDLGALVLFIRHWLAAPDGRIASEDRPAGIRWHLIGRVPPPDHAPPGGLQ